MEFLSDCNTNFLTKNKSVSPNNYEELSIYDKMTVIEDTFNDKINAGYEFKKKDIIDLLKDKACLINKMSVL